MVTRQNRARFLPLAFCGLLAACTPAIARADTFLDIQKKIIQADQAFQENRPGEALGHLSDALGLLKTYTPDDKDYIREAYRWMEKDSAKALKAIQKALDKNPQAAEAYYQRGVVNAPNPRVPIPEVVVDLRKALDLKSGYANPVNKYWDFQAAKKIWELLSDRNGPDYKLAVQQFQGLHATDPKNSQVLFYLGSAQLELNNYRQAADAFLKGVDLKPDDWEFHAYCVTALKKVAGTKGALQQYEQIVKQHPLPDVKLWMADLYLQDDQKAKAIPLLQEVRKENSLELEAASKLAKSLARAELHQEAAEQFGRVLKEFFNKMNENARVNHTTEYGKSLVEADRIDEGIRKLNEALTLFRTYSRGAQEPLSVLFELGRAHWKAGKKDKTRGPDEAEIFFRKYLQELKAGTVGTKRFSTDVEIAESLGDLYLEDHNYRDAAKVFKEALHLIDDAVDKAKCPTARVRFKFVKALHDQGAWEDCIVAARELVADKEKGLQTRRLLAHAYVENHQAAKAITELGQLRNTAVWNEESLLFMGQALLDTNRRTDALKYIEEAYQQRPNDENYALLYAKVLGVVGRSGEARDLYQKILKTSAHSTKALIGLGDLEMELAEAATGSERLDHYRNAVKHFDEARTLGQSTAVLAKLSQAEREQARTEADLQARGDRVRVVLYTGGLILAALIPITFMVYFYRRQWALRCFKEVCALERDLIQLIRDRVRSRWDGAWGNFAGEPFRGRLDFKSLRSRAEKEGTRDILGVANFGHLVAIVDAGWDALGLHELCAPEMVDPKEVIIANLSYISSCRVCLAHVGKLEELTARQMSRGGFTEVKLKAHLSQHLHRQVKTSLRIIRAKFNVTASVNDLPVLDPVATDSEQVIRAKRLD
jgi:tetratricopeptide (TPR) repeat protein